MKTERYSLETISEALEIPITTLRTWIKKLALDADVTEEGEKVWSWFSVAFLLGMKTVSNLSLPAEDVRVKFAITQDREFFNKAKRLEICPSEFVTLVIDFSKLKRRLRAVSRRH